jgi:hypothetical protein
MPCHRICSKTEKVVGLAGDPATIGWTVIRDALTKGQSGDLSRVLVAYRIVCAVAAGILFIGVGISTELVRDEHAKLAAVMAYTTYLWILAAPEKATPLGSKWSVRLRVGTWITGLAVTASFVVMRREGHLIHLTGYWAGVYVGCVLAATLDVLLVFVATVIIAVDSGP